MTELIKKLSAELDEQTRSLAPTAGKLLLLGSRDSVFLKAVAKKAAALGIDYDHTYHFTPPYQGVIVDTETVSDTVRLSADVDIDNSFHPGMSAVSQAVLTLLLAADLVEGKNITIVGRGHAVQGLAQHLIANNATVTVAHSKTPNLLLTTVCRDVVIYATPTLSQPVMSDTYDLVIDLDNAYPDPEQLCCPYVNKIGQLTTSILLNRFVRNGR